MYVQAELIDTIASHIEEDEFEDILVVVIWLVSKSNVQTLNGAMHKYGICVVLGQLTILNCINSSIHHSVRYKPKCCNNETTMYTTECATKKSTRYADKNKIKRAVKMKM